MRIENVNLHGIVMPYPTQDQILRALRAIKHPEKQQDIVSLGMVSDLMLHNDKSGLSVGFSIEIDPNQSEVMEPVRIAAEKAVRQLEYVASVSVVLTAHKPVPSMRPEPVRSKLTIPGVKHIVAVASGKGGVGKSTTAVNLAIAMQQNGLTVGLLDADIYGPSIPRMMNLQGKPEIDEKKKMIPMQRYGLAAMSMGFLVAEDAPMIWRGPMVHSAVTQLFRDVAWEERDIIIVDMPPGTGDAHLTMAQQVPLSGAVIVSTPQDIALLDARKGLNMFKRVDVPVLGIIENMSYFLCPHCNTRSEIFSHGGAHKEAEALGVRFLGEIPLNIEIRQTSDSGNPITYAHPDSAIAGTYRMMARHIWDVIIS